MHVSTGMPDKRAGPDSGGPPADRRRSGRQRTLKEAKVVLSDWTTVDCMIRNRTENGARLVFGGPTTLPRNFELLVISAATLVPVELLWQRGLAAGIAFTGPERPAPPRK